MNISPKHTNTGLQIRNGNVAPCELHRRTAKPDNRESSDTYHAEIFRKDRYRVILCKDAIQWIIQRRGRLAGSRWRGLSYCACRDSLISVWCEDMDLEVPPEMLALPEKARAKTRHPRRNGAEVRARFLINYQD